MKYRIFLNDESVCDTDWLPIAQAAWDRASRDRDAAQHGGDATLLIDGNVVASVRPRTQDGHPWPLSEDPAVDLRDLAKAVMMLARAAGVSTQALAQAMSDDGLPTTASRLKSISTSEQGRRSSTSAAELVAMCYSAATAINRGKP